MAKDKNIGRNNIWKWLALGLIAAFSFYVCNPPLDVKDESGAVVEKGKLRFGLDLRGGSSFVLGIDEERLSAMLIADNPALSNDVEQLNRKIEETLKGSDEFVTSVIRRRVDAMGTNEPDIRSMDKHRVLVQLPGAGDEARRQARANLQNAAFLEFRLTHPNNFKLANDLLSKDVAPEGYKKSGDGYIRLPEAEYLAVSTNAGYYARLANFHTPDPRYVFMLEKRGDVYRPNFVVRSMDEKYRVTGKDLKKAAVDRDSTTGALSIAFELKEDGGRRFATLTRDYQPHGPKNRAGAEGRQLAIILDNELVSAPTINSEISTRGQITGHFTAAEAQKLASELNAGALPAPMKILSESTVAPSVGQEAINAGIVAAGFGFALVAIFMFIYYWRSGLVADVALFLDIALLPTALVVCANILGVFAADAAGSMGGGGSVTLPVLTMPGIAGIVLSLGMAVDANVLIFERIREEFLAKKAAGEAIRNGYGRAFTAIFDSNLTTIITGIILFVVGTGPVRGFAITLTAGVVISMFTAVVVTRLVFDHCVDPDRMKPFRMLAFFKNPKFDFMKCTKFTVAGSFAVIVVTLAIFAFRFANNKADVLSVDLTGGTSIVYNFTEGKQPSDVDVRKALADFDSAAVIQFGVNTPNLLVKTGETRDTAKGKALENGDVGAHVTKLLCAKFPDAGFTMTSVDEIGSAIGDDLKKSGTKAVIFSLIAILVYVGFRFQFGFGLGALVALAHDALISFGLFSLCGRQVSLIVITAVLTIIGYSVNDTVVVFDRIREMLRHDRKLSFYDLCNAAVNSCLSRTVITSVTTFFAVAALFCFGDGSIFDFALIMLIGVVAGTFSSVFIATPIMYWWYKGKRPEFEAEEK